MCVCERCRLQGCLQQLCQVGVVQGNNAALDKVERALDSICRELAADLAIGTSPGSPPAPRR